MNYQRADDITLAPIRAGLGLRLGANIGYLSYSRTRHILPI
ncbi:EipA family protein [Escherichia coli]